MIEPPTIPDPEEVTGEICGHAEEYGRHSAYGSNVIRCGKCGAPLEFVQPPAKLCACQRAGAYDPACLGSGYCHERGRK